MTRVLRTLVCQAVVVTGLLAGAAGDAEELDRITRTIDAGLRDESLELAEDLARRIDRETGGDSAARLERLDALLALLRDRAHVGGPIPLQPVWTERAGQVADGLARIEGPGSVPALLAATRHVLLLIDHRHVEKARVALDDLESRIEGVSDPRVRARHALTRAALAVLENDPRGESLLEQAIGLLREARPDEEGWWAEAQGMLRLLLVRSGRPVDAVAPMESYLDEVERRHGRDSPRAVHALSNLAMAHYSAQRWEDTIEQAQRLVGILRDHYGERDSRLLVATNYLGASLMSIGRYRQARDVFERILVAFEDPDPSSVMRLGRILNNAAVVHRMLGDFHRAHELLARAVQLLGDAEDPFASVLLGTILRAEGEGLIEFGELEQADDVLRHALELQERFHGPSHTQVALIRLRLGTLAVRRGDWTAARREYGTAISALGTLEQGAARDIALAQLWLGRARVLMNEGRHAAAIAQTREVVASYERAVGVGNPRTHVSRLWLARFQRGSGDAAAAAETAASIVREREARGLTKDTLYSEALEEHAAALWELGRLEGSLRSAGLASRAVDARVLALAAAFPEGRVERMLAEQNRPERFLFAALESADPAVRETALRESWEWTLRRRGLVLEELALRHRAAVHEDAEQSALWADFVAARRRLAALWVEGPGDDPDAFTSDIDAALALREQTEEALILNHRKVGRQLRARRVSLDRLRDAVPARTAVVEIVRAPDEESPRDVALIVRADGSLDAVYLCRSGEVDALVVDYREELTRSLGTRSPSSLEALFEAGRVLRRRIWDPILARTGAVEHLLLVPDGPYHLLQPGALPLDDGRFVMERGPSIHLLSTARDLLRTEDDPATEGRGMLALGAPDFGAPPVDRLARLETPPGSERHRGVPYGCFGIRHTAWTDLPGTRSELRRIVDLFEPLAPVEVRLADAASEEALRVALPGKRYAHIATHGFFIPASECSLENATPLLRSGLILAGANRSDATPDPGGEDDGVLTAEELATLDLAGVERVVLSGCDTGRGDVTVGEGVHGMRRALEIAGVRTVVMSLAPVSDAWTERWMTAFYRKLIEGVPTRLAARAASLDCLAALRERGLAPHPYLWAGFVSSGDWR